MNIKKRVQKIKNDIPALFLSLKDADTPIIAKIFAGITVAYALSPIDIIPDFIPFLGYLDDLILLPALIILTTRLIPKSVMDKNRKLALGLWSDGKPKKWYYAIPILIIWILILYLILKAILL